MRAVGLKSKKLVTSGTVSICSTTAARDGQLQTFGIVTVMTQRTTGKIKYKAIHRRPDLKNVLTWMNGKISGITPECNGVPMIGPIDFDNLVNSIAKSGLLDPIRVDSCGKLIDGRSRLMACYVLDKPLAEKHINVTDADSSDIADTNYFRRHLSLDQRLMRATDRLIEERLNAAKRKKAGGDKGRQNKANRTLGTEPVPSEKNNAKRNPKANEIVAKEEGVPRDRLRTASQLREADPELAKQVKDGVLGLDDAVQKSNLPKKKKASSKKQSSKPKKQPTLIANSGNSVFKDPRTNIIELEYDMRSIKTDLITTIECSRLVFGVIVYRFSNTWIVRRTNEIEVKDFKSRADAETAALKIMLQARMKGRTL